MIQITNDAGISNTKLKIENLLEQYKFRDALFEVIDLARKGNKYLQDKEPWKKLAGLDKLKQSASSTAQETQKQIDNSLAYLFTANRQSCHFYKSFSYHSQQKK